MLVTSLLKTTTGRTARAAARAPFASVVAAVDDPERTARRLARGRVVVGAALLVAPRPLLRRAMRGGVASEAVPLLVMLAARDIVLGAGTLRALGRCEQDDDKRGARREAAAWVAAGAAADVVDAASMAGASALRPAPRALGTVVAGGSAGVSALAAARLAGVGERRGRFRRRRT